ncbi:receptor-type tyrosine-protein phosphatase H-like isoform X2 [Rhinichthys klamathensis goyatoka]|uniref:receptor-type tyrosine-protein phosphatase H-like isoform X2 n=1 Tax=Rhinichthys klamathensis goyatoka TaxID=3034132 RepID=UPI0024B4FEE6|nr:receptor-type tyrosine-protein phosphatase H-like isoform X2 [Rhinichthys klamathensis goyatoka]
MEGVLTLVLLCAVSALGQMKPANVGNVQTFQTETELTFQWDIVDGNTSYSYKLMNGSAQVVLINVTGTDRVVTYKVSSLSPGTNYSFTLYTVFNGNQSDGYHFSAVTDPSNVGSVSVVNRKETFITLQWEKVDKRNDYTYELINWNKDEPPELISPTDTLVEHNVTSLAPGTEYSFTLYTVFEDVKSSGYNFSNVTVPSNVGSVSVFDRKETYIILQWDKVDKRNDYTYELINWNKVEPPIHISPTDPLVEHNVTSLAPGTEYSFTLYTVFEDVKSSGYNFSNVTVPSNIANTPTVVDFNDTDVIFQWTTSNKAYNYSLERSNTSREYIYNIGEGIKVTCHINGLIPATNYSFTLYTEFFDVRSTGFTFSHTTSLSRVTEVIFTRSQTQLNITWNKLNKNNIYDYILSESDGNEKRYYGSSEGNEFTHIYSSLTPGTVYSFTLYTEVNGQRNGSTIKSITTINCVSFKWDVTNSSIDAQVIGSTHVKAKSRTSNATILPVVDNRVNLQELYPGDNYTVSLWYYLDSEKLLQCSHLLTLVPNSVVRLRCDHFSGGYGLAVIWDPPYGVVDVVQVDVDKQRFILTSNASQRQEVKSLQAAQWYKVTATSFSGAMKSQTESRNCQTNPAGVIAGVLVFFLLVIIICAAVFLWLRYGSAKRNNSKPLVESKVTKKNYKPIPVDTFPEHFRNMSCDENRGFSEEYEDLSSVGIEQSSAAADLPENKDKNRFSNVLPYDSSRVHLTVNDEEDSDYINASYMPGYGNASKQYIAAQGPLPSTVNDFWRMVWEKRSQAIVMVTNCTESGRVKCEQYWPLDYSPCLYGNLVVTVKSEDKAQSWTLRELNIKNKSTSETRTVKHFHFTAWPDHGVPFGTEELIKFRGRVRQHIGNSYSAGPTVVHCSAGVGRTGTLIALDVLLQQLDREKTVGIAAFVQQMRLCRPLMVQTESQYVFLHQCIMDSLKTKVVAQSEPLYENTDTIYVNSIALKQYENGSKI